MAAPAARHKLAIWLVEDIPKDPSAMNHQAYLDVASSRDKASFEKRLVHFADQMGFPLVSGALVLDRPAEPSLFIPIGNTSDEYAESFSSPELSRKCPVLARMKTLGHPFTYDQSLYVHDGVGYLWEHQAAFGYKTGIAMALHMPGGRHFLLGVDRDEPLPADDVAVIRMMADLQLLGAFAQEVAIRVLMPERVDTQAPTLSAREIEILKWTSVGKSTSVIADILSISVGTVKYHLRNAEAKLGVSGKQAAVVKALNLGLL